MSESLESLVKSAIDAQLLVLARFILFSFNYNYLFLRRDREVLTPNPHLRYSLTVRALPFWRRRYKFESYCRSFKKIKKEIDIMTKEQKMALMKNRLSILESNGKNVKSPGVIRKLQRQIGKSERG